MARPDARDTHWWAWLAIPFGAAILLLPFLLEPRGETDKVVLVQDVLRRVAPEEVTLGRQRVEVETGGVSIERVVRGNQEIVRLNFHLATSACGELFSELSATLSGLGFEKIGASTPCRGGRMSQLAEFGRRVRS